MTPAGDLGSEERNLRAGQFNLRPVARDLTQGEGNLRAADFKLRFGARDLTPGCPQLEDEGPYITGRCLQLSPHEA